MIQEPGVEIVACQDVIRRCDVDAAAGKRVRGIGAHGDVLAGLDERRVGEEGVHDAAEHEWAGGVGREVAVPVGLEVGT